MSMVFEQSGQSMLRVLVSGWPSFPGVGFQNGSREAGRLLLREANTPRVLSSLLTSSSIPRRPRPWVWIWRAILLQPSNGSECRNRAGQLIVNVGDMLQEATAAVICPLPCPHRSGGGPSQDIEPPCCPPNAELELQLRSGEWISVHSPGPDRQHRRYVARRVVIAFHRR